MISPSLILSGTTSILAASIASRLTLLRAAIVERVSPGFARMATVCGGPLGISTVWPACMGVPTRRGFAASMARKGAPVRLAIFSRLSLGPAVIGTKVEGLGRKLGLGGYTVVDEASIGRGDGVYSSYGASSSESEMQHISRAPDLIGRSTTLQAQSVIIVACLYGD